jgi:hypothetical protein
MSASSPRRLLFLLLVVGLAFPSHAAASSWDFGNFLEKAGGFFWALWSPVGCEIEPNGGCGTSPRLAPRDSGCEINPDGLCASEPAQEGSGGFVFGETGCVILPDGRCGA